MAQGLGGSSMRQRSLLVVALAAALLGSVPTTCAQFTSTVGDAFLGDLVTASLSKYNFGLYNDTKGGYGTVSFIDSGEGYSWEVDVFQIEGAVEIVLALATPSLPTLLTLTKAPSPDGISFGLIPYSDLSDAIAASSYPSAGLRDGTTVVVVKFKKPANSALIASITDGNTVTAQVMTPPSPPSLVPPAPDMYSMHPGLTPTIYYAQLDSPMVDILESGNRNLTNATASILVYQWADSDAMDFELELNGLNNPTSLQIRVFQDLVEQPLIMEVIPDQAWSPDTLSYTGQISQSTLQQRLDELGMTHVNLNEDTPHLFFALYDGEDEFGMGGNVGAADAPAPAPTPAAAPPAAAPSVAGPKAKQQPGAKAAAAGGARRRSLQQQTAAVADTGPEIVVDDGTSTTGAGTCGADIPTRIIGFIFDSNSRWKLKPVLKDTSDLPSSVKDIPLYVSAGFLGISGLIIIALYIAGTVPV